MNYETLKAGPITDNNFPQYCIALIAAIGIIVLFTHLIWLCVEYYKLSKIHAKENAKKMLKTQQRQILDDESALIIWKAGQSKYLPGVDNHYGQVEREL